ncbi:hypothetical protein [Croceivirga sp. JEA036]|uniref:hypothetical protein n=1 Tax=Croceivirga sp. JEA036 TaxID=2721162 RepID=UPI001438E15F|nr:hypothetical protein [Croceivirga sp. JEA036]NJB38096.1 hypothetical protein [Croceivirga sp. JEA036]
MLILNNIATKEKLFTIGAMVSATVCIIVSVAAMFIYRSALKESNDKKRQEIYVAVNGSIIKAQLEDDFQRPLEVAHKGFLELFHNYLWSMEPNIRFIERNKKMAREMGDASVDVLFRLLESKGYYSNLIAGDYSVIFEVEEEHITIDYTKEVPTFKLSGTLKTLRTNDIIVKKVVTVGKIMQKSYEFSNFTGFYVRDLEVLEFSEVETIKYKEL